MLMWCHCFWVKSVAVPVILFFCCMCFSIFHSAAKRLSCCGLDILSYVTQTPFVHSPRWSGLPGVHTTCLKVLHAEILLLLFRFEVYFKGKLNRIWHWMQNAVQQRSVVQPSLCKFTVSRADQVIYSLLFLAPAVQHSREKWRSLLLRTQSWWNSPFKAWVGQNKVMLALPTCSLVLISAFPIHSPSLTLFPNPLPTFQLG